MPVRIENRMRTWDGGWPSTIEKESGEGGEGEGERQKRQA